MSYPTGPGSAYDFRRSPKRAVDSANGNDVMNPVAPSSSASESLDYSSQVDGEGDNDSQNDGGSESYLAIQTIP
jgi:hypothetical protein